MASSGNVIVPIPQAGRPPHRPAFFYARGVVRSGLSRRTRHTFDHAGEAQPTQPTADRRRRGAAAPPCGRRARHHGRLPGSGDPALDPDDPRALRRGRCEALHPHDPAGLARRNGLRVCHSRRGDRPVPRLGRAAPRSQSEAPRHRVPRSARGPRPRDRDQGRQSRDSLGLRTAGDRAPGAVDSSGQRGISGRGREGGLPLRRADPQLGSRPRRPACGCGHVLHHARGRGRGPGGERGPGRRRGRRRVAGAGAVTGAGWYE